MIHSRRIGIASVVAIGIPFALLAWSPSIALAQGKAAAPTAASPSTKELTVPMNQYMKEAFAVPNTHPAWP